jgi:hypothetical protein
MAKPKTYGDLSKAEVEYYLNHPEIMAKAEENYQRAISQLDAQLKESGDGER